MPTNYPTDLTDAQYDAKLQIMNDKRKYSLREIWNAILYLHKTGCHWRMLPSDFPKWQLVYYYLDKWTYNGTIEQLNDDLRERTLLNLHIFSSILKHLSISSEIT